MRNKKIMLPQTKSYTRISDIFGSDIFDRRQFSNFSYRNPIKNKKDQPITEESIAESDKKSILKNAPVENKSPYVTCEKYHGLNKTMSDEFVARSDSTIFCDLDDIAKRHSFHCLTEASASNANILKVMKLQSSKNAFSGRSNAIVQECATQIQPQLLAKDSIEINTKKIKRNITQNDVLSSEIYLKDYGQHCKNNRYYNTDITMNHQKFWSYAKYRTEYTKPASEEKCKKKDRGKLTENPCPCQLFSYACPCTDEKSLTNLAKNSKCLTVLDQVTSTSKLNRRKKQAHDMVRDDKPTNTNVIIKNETMNSENETLIKAAEKQVHPIPDVPSRKPSPRGKSKINKKTHKVTCPVCKEKVEVVSITDDEESLKCEHSSLFHCKELAYNYSTSKGINFKYKPDQEEHVCTHEPRCDLVPVCQLLPTEDIMFKQKPSKKQSSTKSSPRVIRITKACRHHPPCTVVPSCQRANVLRNNCEFIPPCLHRPRCINLPLCVPFYKSIHYEEPCNAVEDNSENFRSNSKYMPLCQHDSIANSTERRHINTQNCNEFLNDYHTATYMVNPKSTLMSTVMTASCQRKTSPCCSCRSNKSCQCECLERVLSTHLIQENSSSDAIVFIRDVGCQFQYTQSPQNSLVRSKTSSASFDLIDVDTGNYYTAVHTMRCEEKFTNFAAGLESVPANSIRSMEVDSHCPSHGQRNRFTGFRPSQRYVTAFASSDKPSLLKEVSRCEVARRRDSMVTVKSRRNFLKGKCRKVFAAKRRRRSVTSSQVLTPSQISH